MKARLFTLCIFCTLFTTEVQASKIFIPMDADSQTDHLKAYGIAYAALMDSIKVDWLLNYRGGSYALDYNKEIAVLCKFRHVSYVKMSNKEYAQIAKQVNDPAFNGAIVKLEKAPKIAVYNPSSSEPWDDAVSLALGYAEIPYDKLYADEVLAGDLEKYDWVHLHHQDFTGQYGKFYNQFGNTQWYKDDQKAMEAVAAKHGFKKVSQLQLAVVKKIRDFVANGGNMFAMCSATETFDIALAAEHTDICPGKFDGDPVDVDAQRKLDFSNCLAFKDFAVYTSRYNYEHSSIDNTSSRNVTREDDHFNLLSFTAKFDQVPAMLCQNHTTKIKGFMGQTTAFSPQAIKPDVTILGDFIQTENTRYEDGKWVACPAYMTGYEARYLHGECGKGTWTFYGGHDPEDYRHAVGNPATDLSQYPNSPGYRLILNNVLFPAAKRTIVPTVVINSKEKEGSTTMSENIVMLNSVTIYPNPTSGAFSVSIATGKIQQVTILNVTGQEVFTRSCDALKVDIDLKELPAGMYLMKVNGEYAGKVVKN